MPVQNHFCKKFGLAVGLAASFAVSPHIFAAENSPVKLATFGKGQNQYYGGNRPPLLPSAFVKLPVGSIRPEGWLRQQLMLMADGFTGHLPEISKWCKFEGSAWTSPTGEGQFGWEEMPYWLKGFVDLGYV